VAFAAALCATWLAAQDKPAATPLQRGQVVRREISGGQEHVYSLTLGQGEFAAIAVNQLGIDVVVKARGPDGKAIAEFDRESRTQGRELVTLVAATADRFELAVQPRYPRAPAAEYDIGIVEVRPATERDRALFDALTLSGQSQAAVAAGKYDDAIQLAGRALALEEKAAGPDDAYTGLLLIRLADLDRIKGNYAQAVPLFERALAISQSVLGREHPQTAFALRKFGVLYRYMGEYGKAEPLIEEAVAITERVLGADHPLTAAALMDLSGIHEYRQDLQKALAERQRALDIAEKTLAPDDIFLIGAVNNLGDLYSLMGDNRRAEPLLERALALAEKKLGPDHPSVSIPLQDLGIVARQTGRYARARDFLWRAEAIREKSLGSRHPDTIALLINIANLYHAEGDYGRALELHRRTLDTLLEVCGPYHRLTLMALANVGRTYGAQGDFGRALEYQTRYTEALEKNLAFNLAIGSEQENLAYLRSTYEHTDRTVTLHARDAPGDPAARDLAALVLLRQKGRLLDAMAGSMSALRGRLSPDDRKLLDQLQEADAGLARLALGGPGKNSAAEFSNQLAALDQRKESLEAEVSRRSVEFRAGAQPVTLAAIEDAIPPDAALLEYAAWRPFDWKKPNEDQAYGPARYIVYVFRHTGQVRWADLGPVHETDEAVSALRQGLRDSRRTDVREVARAVDRRIVEPVLPLVGDATRLLISPEGDLSLIPFEALIDAQGRYLVESRSISYLTAGRDQESSGPVVLADPFFGEPAVSPVTPGAHSTRTLMAGRRSILTGDDLSGVYFAPLPGTAAEAHNIQSLFPEARVFTGRQATKSLLLHIESPDILHIATHGFFLRDLAGEQTSAGAPPENNRTRAIQADRLPANPLLRSGLALAGANITKGLSNDGILTALEAANLNLWGTQVVTLSACETGVGEAMSSEGVYGLRRAFFLAGAETLVMSLWPVSDRATREIMAAYYTGLKSGLGRGEALRRAQLQMLQHKDRRHPYYWAGFIQAGDWEKIDTSR
jgi:CHAT domain-containing protein